MEDEASIKECFTSVHSRRIGASSLVSCRLCPSMDLIVFGVTSHSQQQKRKQQQTQNGQADTTDPPAASGQLVLYRSVAGQKLAIIRPVDEAVSNNDDDNDGADGDTSKTSTLITHAAWRPDGRLLAFADTMGRVTIQEVESFMIADTPASSSSMLGGAESNNQPIISLSLYERSPNLSHHLKGLVWLHVGRPHPLWPSDPMQPNSNVDFYNPPTLSLLRIQSASPTNSSSSESLGSSDSLVPTSQTPLSVLGAITESSDGEYKLHICLHGCYPILQEVSIPHSAVTHQSTTSGLPSCPGKSVQLVASNNLTQLVLHIPTSDKLVLYSIPSFQHKCSALQSISALYSSTLMTHLKKMQQDWIDITGAWKSSIKPLDVRIQALTRLLENYGLQPKPSDSNDDKALAGENLRKLLRQYIVSGHTLAAPNLSNAMDQFFTGVQMNDQLLVRLERSLAVAVANVEVQVRQLLHAPAQALVDQFSRFHGLARYLECDDGFLDTAENSRKPLLSSRESLRCLQYSQFLLLSVEKALSALVEARFRLRDWVNWLRSVGAQTKARGTAPQSARHENARKRRVPDAVVHRLLGYMQHNASNKGEGVTESILGLMFPRYLQSSDDFVVESKAFVRRPDSPSSVIPEDRVCETPTIPFMAEKLIQSAKDAFAAPRQFLQTRITTTCLNLSKSEQTIAMTTRIGWGGGGGSRIFGDPDPDGFYCPNPSSSASYFRQWLVLASTEQGSKDQALVVHLHAIPLSWDGAGLVCESVWTRSLQFSGFHQVLDLEFYNDDGKSALTVHQTDSQHIGTTTDGYFVNDASKEGKEGSRQALVLVLRRKVAEDDADNTDTDHLCLVDYSSLHLHESSLEGHTGERTLPLSSPDTLVTVRPMDCREADSQDSQNSEEEGLLYTKTRKLGPSSTTCAAKLMVSGSRGMVAVEWTNPEGITWLQLYDPEEDEEDDEDDDDMEEGE